MGYSAAEGLMLVAEEAVEIRVLSRQGKSIREIARLLKVSRNTVRRYVRGEGLPRWSCPAFVEGVGEKGRRRRPMPRTHPAYAPDYRRRIIELARTGRPLGS